MKRTASLLSAAVLLLVFVPALAAQDDGIPRTASGRPDLNGTYDAATLTPLERPVHLGERAYLTPEEAAEIAEEERLIQEGAVQRSDANREAPPEGGAKVVGLEHTAGGGNEFGAGNVGGYNLFWIDRGTDTYLVDGQIPTSIIIDPPNGRMPPMTDAAQAQLRAALAGIIRPNDGTAWWVEHDGPGPYDGPESLPTSERCLAGFTGAAPTFPSLYNNYKRIAQTETHVVILLEMIHDARIVRLNSEHPGPEVTKWLGDSIGWWEGDTLVVDTTNFRVGGRGFRGGSENTHVVERFSVQHDGNVIYNFTVEDDTVWTAPWTGEYLWKAAEGLVYEYACHEGNYSMGGTLRGARLLESEALSGASTGAE
ncbi:MAG: hypothetical protein OYL92_04735 [Acidobacteriota bacterium]|nr:hypothetical protein [Acidobacteriota bacterium]MDE3264260.1 hypothetical protein [Acidobacteriota bacterium]